MTQDIELREAVGKLAEITESLAMHIKCDSHAAMKACAKCAHEAAQIARQFTATPPGGHCAAYTKRP